MANGDCIAGDSGNMVKYSTDHHIQLMPYNYINVEDSDDAGKRASLKFQSIYKVKSVFKKTPISDAVDLLLK